MRQKLAKQAESSGLGRIVSQPQSDLYIMFLLCEMFQHKFGCFIQNHPFHRRQVLCWRYVRQNRQVCSVEAGGWAVSQSQSERRQPTKSQNMSFRHFYIVPSLSVEGSKNINCFFSGFQSISPFFTCGMSCIGNLSVHYLLLFIGCFSVSKQMLKTIQHLKILTISNIGRNLLLVPLTVAEREE